MGELLLGYVLGTVMTWVLFVRPAMNRLEMYHRAMNAKTDGALYPVTGRPSTGDGGGSVQQFKPAQDPTP